MVVDDGHGGPQRAPTSRGFRDLRVWQSAMDLVESVYLVTRAFPRDEIYGLTSQMCRAVVSVPSNIAEGQSRQNLPEYLHFLSIAQGSLGELETQLEISGRLGFVSADDAENVMDAIGLVSPQLRALRIALDRRSRVVPSGNGMVSRPASSPRRGGTTRLAATQNPEPGT